MSEIEFLSAAAPVSMAAEWFEFATPDHFWMQWRHRVLLQQLKRLNAQIRNALEVGCGNGVVRELVERDLGIAVDGCDLNEHALRMATKRKGRLLLYDIFDQNPALLQAYDMILLMDVIEHLDDDLKFLQAALRHLKPGGIVVLNVPAHMAFYGRYDDVAGHKRRYNRVGIDALFRKAQVEPLAIVYWGFSLVPVLVLRHLVLRFVSRAHTIRVGFAESSTLTRGIFRILQRIETNIPYGMPTGSSLLALGRLSSPVLAS